MNVRTWFAPLALAVTLPAVIWASAARPASANPAAPSAADELPHVIALPCGKPKTGPMAATQPIHGVGCPDNVNDPNAEAQAKYRALLDLQAKLLGLGYGPYGCDGCPGSMTGCDMQVQVLAGNVTWQLIAPTGCFEAHYSGGYNLYCSPCTDGGDGGDGADSGGDEPAAIACGAAEFRTTELETTWIDFSSGSTDDLGLIIEQGMAEHLKTIQVKGCAACPTDGSNCAMDIKFTEAQPFLTGGYRLSPLGQSQWEVALIGTYIVGCKECP